MRLQSPMDGMPLPLPIACSLFLLLLLLLLLPPRQCDRPKTETIAANRNGFLKAIRTQTTLPDSIRELAICRVAALNQAWYEWDQHVKILEATNVLSADAIQYLREKPSKEETKEGLLDNSHTAVLEYTDAMTIGCVVPRIVFDRVENVFSEREVTELTATIAAYNCVSRFLVALDVGEMGAKYGVDMN